MESSYDEIQTPKRAPRKRAPAKRVSVDAETKSSTPSKTAATKTPRKRVVRKVTKEEVIDERVIERVSDPVVSEKVRKAPTVFASEQQAARRLKRQMIVVAVVLLTGVGSSAAVGFTDKGQIDVQKTIEERNERIRNNTATEKDTIVSRVEVPVQDTTAVAKENKADGGLIGRGTGGGVPKPKSQLPVANASTTENIASSTETVASSTEEVIEDSSENEDVSENTDTLNETNSAPQSDSPSE